MSKAGTKLIAAAQEAVSITKGEQPAARITMAGHHYVPELKWQPIETAPRDGSVFLGGWFFQGRWLWRLAKWNEYHKKFNQYPHHHSGPYSHWQPLPPPPSSVV